MPIITQVVCDFCGVVKGATNHWYLVRSRAGAFTTLPLPSALVPEDLTDEKLCCGQRCAMQAYDRYLNGKAIDAIASPTESSTTFADPYDRETQYRTYAPLTKKEG